MKGRCKDMLFVFDHIGPNWDFNYMSKKEFAETYHLDCSYDTWLSRSGFLDDVMEFDATGPESALDYLEHLRDEHKIDNDDYLLWKKEIKRHSK